MDGPVRVGLDAGQDADADAEEWRHRSARRRRGRHASWGRRHALGCQEHARASLGELDGAAQTGEAGTDDDDVRTRRHRPGSRRIGQPVGRQRAAHHRQQEEQARKTSVSWSPQAMGFVPRNRSAAKLRSAAFASGAAGASRPSARRCRGSRSRVGCRMLPGTAPCRAASCDAGRRARIGAPVERLGQPVHGDELALAHQLGVSAALGLDRRQPVTEPVRAVPGRFGQRLVGGAARRIDAEGEGHRVDDVARHEPVCRELATDDAPHPADPVPGAMVDDVVRAADLAGLVVMLTAANSVASYSGREPA